MIERSWSNIVTVSCIVIAGVVEAVQQAINGAPDVRLHLPTFATSPNVNFVPLFFLVIAGVVWLLSRRDTSVQSSTATTTTASAQSTVTPSSQFLNVDDFYRTYDNVFLREVEDLVLKQSSQYQPGSDRERYLIRYSATVLGTALFEYLWWQIFGSQLRLMQTLNSKALPLEDARRYYDEGAQNRPEFYKAYSFEQWLAFLREAIFIVESGSTVQITIRGREFLKYLTHCGYDISEKGG